MALKTLQYELSNWMGMDRWTPETECDPHYWYDIQNMECDESGVTAKRRGAIFVSSFSGTINMIYDHQDQINQVQAALVVAGSTLHVISSFGQAGQTTSATFATSDCRHYAITSDVGVTFISLESGGPIKMITKLGGSTWTFQDANLAASTYSVTIVAGGTVSDSFAGSFSAMYSYIDVWGNESPLSPESNTISVTNSGIEIPIVPSSDPTVDYLKFYVLGPGMEDYQFSGTASNTSGTYSHSMTMAELMGGDLAPLDLVAMPEGKYISMYEDMLLVAGDVNVPDTVWCSDRQYHRQWEDNFARCVTGDGQPIRGFGDSYDRKLVYKADSLHLCEGDHQDTFRTRKYNSQYGATGQTGISVANQAGCWWSDDGLYVDDGRQGQEVSRRILMYLRTLDPVNMIDSPPRLAAATYKYYRQYLLALREYQVGQTGPNDVLLVWNFLRDNWTKHKGNVPHTMGVVQLSDDYEYLYGGDVNGNVWWFSPPNYSQSNDDQTTGGTASTISCYAETPWMNFAKLKQAPDWERTRCIPRYLQIYASGQAKSGSDYVTLDCGYYVDFNRDVCVSSFSVQFNAHDWPTVRPYKQTIYYGGAVGTYNWSKWRFEHAREDEHIRIHKLVWGFRLKPSID